VGLKAVGHIPNECTIDDAIAAGQASLEHMMMVEKLVQKAIPPGTPVDDDRSGGIWPSGRYWFLYPKADKAALAKDLRTLAASGMMQCPTLVVSAGIASAVDHKGAADPRMEYVPTHLRAFWSGEQYQGFGRFMEGALPHMKSMAGEMHRAGVGILAGSDVLNPYCFPGFSLHDELEWLVKAGLSPMAALQAATRSPAMYLERAQDLGTVEKGKIADLVLLDADPTLDIRNTRRIAAVVAGGKLFDRAALDRMLGDVERLAGAN